LCYSNPSEEVHGNPMVGPHPRSGPEVKNRSSAADGAPERFRCGTIQKGASWILQMSAGAARRIFLSFYPV